MRPLVRRVGAGLVVLIIDQLGPYGPFNTAMVSGIRAAVSRDPGGPVSLYAELLDLARFSFTGPEYEAIIRSTITTKPKGMGLAICRSITEAHHGKLWASLGVRFGAIFHLILPSAEPPEEGSPGKSDEACRTEPLTSA